MSKNPLEDKIEKLSVSTLYDRFSLDIYRYAFSLLKNREEAKDAMQEVFVKYVEHENSFKEQCSQKTWLFIIARNYCYNRMKSSDYNWRDYSEEEIKEEYELNVDWKISIRDALMKLSQEQNELIFLVDYAGYTYKEIAELTNLSLENVKIKIFRARQELRNYLKES